MIAIEIYEILRPLTD